MTFFFAALCMTSFILAFCLKNRILILALTVVPLACYFLFRPVKWSKRTVWMIAGALGAASVFAV